MSQDDGTTNAMKLLESPVVGVQAVTDWRDRGTLALVDLTLEDGRIIRFNADEDSPFEVLEVRQD